MTVDDDAMMPAPPASIERTQAALESRLAGKPGILGIGVGEGRESGRPALRVYVKSKAISATLPSEIDGIEVVGDVVGVVKAF
jgi:hypothetical protein